MVGAIQEHDEALKDRIWAAWRRAYPQSLHGATTERKEWLRELVLQYVTHPETRPSDLDWLAWLRDDPPALGLVRQFRKNPRGHCLQQPKRRTDQFVYSDFLGSVERIGLV
jgi:hypothetical protein